MLDGVGKLTKLFQTSGCGFEIFFLKIVNQDIDQDYLPNEEELNEENFVRISSRHVVSDAIIDYDDKGTSSKRVGIVLQMKNGDSNY